MSEKLLNPTLLERVLGKVLMKTGKLFHLQRLFELGFDLYNFGRIEE